MLPNSSSYASGIAVRDNGVAVAAHVDNAGRFRNGVSNEESAYDAGPPLGQTALLFGSDRYIWVAGDRQTIAYRLHPQNRSGASGEALNAIAGFFF